MCYLVKKSEKCKFVPRVLLMTFAVALARASLSDTREVTKNTQPGENIVVGRPR